MKLNTVSVALCSTLISIYSTLSHAAVTAPNLSLQLMAGGPGDRQSLGGFDSIDLGCVNESDVTATCSGGGVSTNWADGTFDLDSWSVFVDTDPVISASFDVVNNTGATQWYTMIFTLPIAPAITPSSVIGGSVGVTLTDTNGSGATLSSAGGLSIYQAQIDGATVETLLDDPYNLAAGTFLSSVDSASFGNPIPSQSGPQALSTIGLRFDFNLSAGDRAAFTSVFVVEPNPVPLPATAWLFGSAVAGLIGLRAKRK